MNAYQITCVTMSPLTGSGHHHIIGVGIAAVGQTISVPEAYQLMNAGHRLYTVSPSTGAIAGVRRYQCCGIDTLISHADAVRDNNLDNLAPCR
ncbi:MAG: DUF3892 domain-containing protein [Streptosporangiaceae bacterium]